MAMRFMHKQTERETQQRAALSERQAKADRNRSEGEAIKYTSLTSYAQKCDFGFEEFYNPVVEGIACDVLTLIYAVRYLTDIIPFTTLKQLLCL